MDRFRFEWNERLRISIPMLLQPWELYDRQEQTRIIEQWELVRGTIPDRVKEFEIVIVQMLAELQEENNFERSCRLNDRISDYASRINDLQIWYRTDQDLDTESRRHT